MVKGPVLLQLRPITHNIAREPTKYRDRSKYTLGHRGPGWESFGQRAQLRPANGGDVSHEIRFGLWFCASHAALVYRRSEAGRDPRRGCGAGGSSRSRRVERRFFFGLGHAREVIHSKGPGQREGGWLRVHAGAGEECGRVGGCEGARGFIAQLSTCCRVGGNGTVLGWSMAIVQLAKDQVPVNFLRRVEAGPIGGLRRVESNLDPVISTSVAFGLAVCIGGQIRANDDVAATEQLAILARRVGVVARVVFTDHTLRDTLVFINHLPLHVLRLVTVENTLGRHFLGLLARAVEAAGGGRFW